MSNRRATLVIKKPSEISPYRIQVKHRLSTAKQFRIGLGELIMKAISFNEPSIKSQSVYHWADNHKGEFASNLLYLLRHIDSKYSKRAIKRLERDFERNGWYLSVWIRYDQFKSVAIHFKVMPKRCCFNRIISKFVCKEV